MKKSLSSSMPIQQLVLAAITLVAAVFSTTTCFGIDLNPVHLVQKVGEGAQKVGEGAANLGKAVVTGAGNVIQQGGKAVEGIGGDGAKILGQAVEKGGQVISKVGDAAGNLAIMGVAKPAGDFVISLGATVGELTKIDIRHPETFESAIKHAAGTGSGVVLDAERALERAALDSSDLVVSSLPSPIEKGVRHLSAEAIKEIEKKNPQLAKLLRQLPTSILYNYLRNLAGDEMTCDPGWIFPSLDTGHRKKLDALDKWSGFFTTPDFKGAGISGWTTTNCRGTALGIVRGAAYSTDNIFTIDLELVALSVGGQDAHAAGRYLRIEILPIGRAHEFALFHHIREGEAILTSGRIMRDEDGPWFELHPVDDLEVVATPTNTPAVESPRGVVGHFVAPTDRNQAARFSICEVKSGDSLSSIAQQFYGRQDWKVLAAANRSQVTKPDLIRPGWRLNIPIRTNRGVGLIAGKAN